MIGEERKGGGGESPKIEPMGEEESAAYRAFRKAVFANEGWEDIQKELTDLENAEEVFRLRMGNNITSETGGGNFIFNPETGEFDVNFGGGQWTDMESLAHELKHADQYLNKKLGFDLLTGKVIAYDALDEIEAFERQGVFGNTISKEQVFIHPEYSKLPNFRNNLRIDQLQNQALPIPYYEMIKQNRMYQEHNKIRFMYYGWQNDIR
ncbi:MAG: hypothetical protein HUJ97_10125 [Bacteroidales bacterium]|nr:hypothetical protein [Bacteroidales bacterium]